MSDDSFIREVDEELRSERVQDFWKKYGKALIALAVFIVLAVAAYRFFDYYQQQQAAASGDAFMEAVRLTDSDKQAEALAALQDLQSEAGPTYAALAKLRVASELAKSGKVAEALAAYDEIAQDSATESNLQSFARLRAGLLLVDTGTVTEVEARVGPLSGPGHPYRATAREALALAYYKAGDLDKSAGFFDQIIADEGAPGALKQRSRLMRELIASRGGPAVTSN